MRRWYDRIVGVPSLVLAREFVRLLILEAAETEDQLRGTRVEVSEVPAFLQASLENLEARYTSLEDPTPCPLILKCPHGSILACWQF